MRDEEKRVQPGFPELPELADSECQASQPKPKLDKTVLIMIIVGIALIYLLMVVINSSLYMLYGQTKTSYYHSIIASNALFVLLILVIKFWKKITWAELGWKNVKFLRSLKDVLIVWGVTWLAHIIYMLIIVSQGIMPEDNALSELLEKPTLLLFIANIVLIAIVAPFIEETLFRGLLFSSLRTYFGCWTAIVLSAIVFSALHLELIGFVPRLVLGIGLGYLYVKSGSLFPSIGLHGLNNFVAVLLVSAFS